MRYSICFRITQIENSSQSTKFQSKCFQLSEIDALRMKILLKGQLGSQIL